MSEVEEAAQNVSWGTGGLDPGTLELFDAHFECFDCGLFYSWPVTPGLAANVDPKQTEMLALARTHTAEACRTIRAVAPVMEIEAANEALLARVRASNIERKYRRYWIEVTGDTAMELEGLGLIVRHLDKTGKPTIFPITREPSNDPGRALSMAAGRLRRGLSSDHPAGAPTFKLSGGDVVGDVRGSHFTITADDLVGRIIPSVIDALRISDPAFPGDVELDKGPSHTEIDRQEDLFVEDQPGVNDPVQRVDDGPFTCPGSVPVNFKSSHNSSPSVGAPIGAVRDNSNPTEGEPHGPESSAS